MKHAVHAVWIGFLFCISDCQRGYSQGVLNFFSYNAAGLGFGRVYTDRCHLQLAGSGWFAQVYGAPFQDYDRFLPMAGVDGGTGIDELSSGVANYGLVQPAAVYGYAVPGSTWYYRVFAWTGAATWEEALLSPTGRVGASEIVTVTLGGPTQVIPQANAWQSFDTAPLSEPCVPEPGSLGLGVFGGLVVCLALACRRIRWTGRRRG